MNPRISIYLGVDEVESRKAALLEIADRVMPKSRRQRGKQDIRLSVLIQMIADGELEVIKAQVKGDK